MVKGHPKDEHGRYKAGAYKKTPETVKMILDNLKLGLNRDDSAELAGIDKKTFYNWLNSDSSFSTAVKKAELECKQRLVAIVQKAAVNTWQAAMTLLERKYPDEFGQKKFPDMAIMNKEGGQILIKFEDDRKALPKPEPNGKEEEP